MHLTLVKGARDNISLLFCRRFLVFFVYINVLRHRWTEFLKILPRDDAKPAIGIFLCDS